jgi:diadenosine tetraphosphate (Ap4A) HIT family hydrolase
MTECIICRKHSGDFLVPGGRIYQDEWVYACHAHWTDESNTVYLGWLVVETRRHVPGLAEITDEEGQALGLLIARLSRVIKLVTDAEHIYAFVVGHGVPHLHVHLLPRYPGTPREYWGLRIDEWPEAPRGDESEIMALCDQIRKEL